MTKRTTALKRHALRLMQFTDCHLFGDPAGALRGVTTLAGLDAVLAHARLAHGHWDATLLTGDLVHDDPSGYARIRERFGAERHPVYCIPGNHDLPEAMRASLNGAPFQLNGHAVHGNWLLVMLDSFLARRASGRLADAELARLATTLARYPDHHALVAVHHHPIDSRSHWLDQVGLENPEALFGVLASAPQVRAVLFGHVHQQLEHARGRLKLLGTPSTCAQFKPLSEGFAIDGLPPAYRWLALGTDGQVATGVEWVLARALPQARAC